MLGHLINWLLVLVFFCASYSETHSLTSKLDNRALVVASLIQMAGLPNTNAMAANEQRLPATPTSVPRMSRCDEDTGLVRLRGLPLCQYDHHMKDEAELPLATIKYRVLVGKGLEQHATTFAQGLKSVLGSSSGWHKAGLVFARVYEGEDLTIILAQPHAVDRLCRPLRTQGEVSCAIAGRAVINVKRWLEGAKTWGKEVERYRHYLINHEVGHLLGVSHARCPKAGAPAPIMLQQTISLNKCVVNETVTAVDLALLRRYMPILKRRLRSVKANRLKIRPRIHRKNRKRKFVRKNVRKAKNIRKTKHVRKTRHIRKSKYVHKVKSQADYEMIFRITIED